MNARNDEQLGKLSESLKPILVAKCDALDKLIEDNKQAEVKVSEKTTRFWEMKRVATSMILDVLEDGEKPTSELDSEAKGKREEYFKAAAQAWAGLKDVLVQLSKEIMGPYALGMSEFSLPRKPWRSLTGYQATSYRSLIFILRPGLPALLCCPVDRLPMTETPSYGRSRST